MKAKLLKKTRKRYEIRKIERLASNSSDSYKYAKAKFGLPFYVAIDKYEDEIFDFNIVKVSNNIETCKQAILSKVIEQYREKFRHVSEISIKVWP